MALGRRPGGYRHPAKLPDFEAPYTLKSTKTGGYEDRRSTMATIRIVRKVRITRSCPTTRAKKPIRIRIRPGVYKTVWV